jgi:hypothetical protein
VLAHNILRRHPMTSPSLSRWRTCRDLYIYVKTTTKLVRGRLQWSPFHGSPHLHPVDLLSLARPRSLYITLWDEI